MIIDQIALSGTDAYLLRQDTATPSNLASPPGTGRSLTPGEGNLVEVEALELHIEGEALIDVFARQDAPLFSVRVHKEIFPGLYTDPYAHRVHHIGGAEDLKRGTLDNGRVMDVDGIPVLVTTGTDRCTWTSGIYALRRAATIDAVAWDLATTKLTQEDGFEYGLTLLTWSGPPYSPQTASLHPLAADGTAPGAPRLNDHLDLVEVAAYQVKLVADVKHDAALRERHTGPRSAASLGRPILRAVNIVERVTPQHSYASLSELAGQSKTWTVLEETATGAPRRVIAEIDLAATLTKEERIELTVNGTWAAVLEARLKARWSTKPPTPDVPNS